MTGRNRSRPGSGVPRRRGLALAITVALTALLALSTALGAAPARATGAEDASRLAAEFSTCAQQRGAADVLLLLDRSLSLKDSDPELVRRDASRDLARQLAEYAQRTGIDLQMQVAGFDGAYQANPWHTLEPDSLDPVLAEIDDMTSNEGLGPATDYWMALDGARAQFAAQAQDRDACQLLLWFSDGEYDVDEKGSFGTSLPYAPGVTLNADTKDEVIQAGKDSICSAKKGPMNPMRATGVFVATVGLNGSTDPDLGFLRQATDGSGGCGRPPLADHTAFLEAQEAGSLTLAIAAVSGGQSSDAPYDGRDAALAFGLDEAVAKASVLAYAGPDAGATEFGLSGPTGQTVWFGSGAPATQTVSGAQVAFEAISASTARFSIPRSTDTGWKGTWTVHLRAAQALPATSKAQMVVTVSGDLQPVWVDPVAEAGIDGGLDLTIHLQTGAGTQFTADHPGVRVSVSYLDSHGASTTLKSGLTAAQLHDPVHVDLPASPGAGQLSLRLDLTTDTDPPTQVLPVVTSYDLLLTAAGDYPTLARPQFATAAGTDPSTGVVAVTGPGCVWLDVADSETGVQSVPDGVDEVTVSGDAVKKASCVELEAGETRDFHVTLTPSAQANGSIVGELTMRAAPTGPGSDITATLPYSAQRTKVENATTKWWTLAVVTLAGLLLGALPLVVSRARLARIRVRDQHGLLQVARQRFTLVDGQVSGFRLRQEDLRPVHSGAEQTVRRLDIDGVTIVPRALGNPFTVPDCEVTRQGGPVVTSATTSAAEGTTARLPLVLTGQWVAWPVGPGEFESMVFLSAMEVLDSVLGSTQQTLTERIGSAAAVLAGVAAPDRPTADVAAPSATTAPPPGDDWADPVGGWGQPGTGPAAGTGTAAGPGTAAGHDGSAPRKDPGGEPPQTWGEAHPW